MRSHFVTDLTWRDIGVQKYMLTAPLVYYSALLKTEITIPAGFITDGESVPRCTPIINSLFGCVSTEPWVLHDWLYYIGTYGRKVSDRIGLEAQKTVRDVPSWRESGIYIGLRIGGWWAWHQHRKAGHSSNEDFKKNLEIYK